MLQRALGLAGRRQGAGRFEQRLGVVGVDLQRLQDVLLGAS